MPPGAIPPWATKLLWVLPLWCLVAFLAGVFFYILCGGAPDEEDEP